MKMFQLRAFLLLVHLQLISSDTRGVVDEDRMISELQNIFDIANKDNVRDNIEDHHVIESSNKRSILGAVLLAFDVIDLGLNVYRDLADCTIEAPTLEGNVRKFSELSSKLKFEKDMANLDWVKVGTQQRYMSRLNSTINSLNYQLSDTNLITHAYHKKPLDTVLSDSGNSIKNVGNIQASVLEGANNIIGLVTVANNIWEAIQHHEECTEKEEEAAKSVESLEAALNETMKLRIKVNDTIANETHNYSLVKVRMFDGKIQKKIIEFHKEMSDAVITSFIKEKLLAALLDVIDNYNTTTQKHRDEMMQLLTGKAMPIVLQYHMCAGLKKKVEEYIINECKIGTKSFNELFVNSVKGFTAQCNHLMQLDKNITHFQTVEQMKLLQKNIICVRNNERNRQAICSFTVEESSSSLLNLSRLLKVSLEDVKSFLSLCEKKSVPSYVAIEICVAKTENKELLDVQRDFNKWKAYQVKRIYENCTLDRFQIERICHFKMNGYTHETIRNKFLLYDIKLTKAVFDSCKKLSKVTPSDMPLLCFLKQLGNSTTHSLYTMMLTKYEKETITDAQTNCKNFSML